MDKMEILNRYDRVTVSFHSFDPVTFERMTGTWRMPDLAGILRTARIPVQVSCLVNEGNVHQIREFLARCREMGVRRVVIRRQYMATSEGKRRLKPLLRTELRAAGCRLVAAYRENPVYEYGGMEVTCWDFAQSTSRSVNLFSDGTISAEYLLIRSQKIYNSFTPSPSTWRGKAAIMEPR
jgi:MoaA/NifB/PqqE/SkfB family radical SAM enzyme